MQIDNRFSGRAAVITGGASGLGKAVAKRIQSEGGRICLWDSNVEQLEQAGREVGASHVRLVDVSDPEAVQAAAHAANGALGRIDILVTSAGITGATEPVHEFPIDSYGRIVNVSSVAGKEGNPNASAYSASKAGVIGFTKSLAKELATRCIIANAITPATFDSPILEQLPQSQVDYMLSKIPMARLGNVEESAAMVCFMASEECSFTTGATFDTSGGRTTF